MADALLARFSDTEADEVKIDASTLALHTIDYAHHEVHAGSFYRAFFQKDVTNAGTAILALTTPDTAKWLHIRPAVDAEAEATVAVYENPTSATGGTAVVPVNANRNSANTSGATLASDPTVNTAGAVVLASSVIGSGKSEGGNSGAEYEWILKQNETYLFHITNNTTSNNQISIRLSWYEHTDRH